MVVSELYYQDTEAQVAEDASKRVGGEEGRRAT
jgi:hypothetical protein